MNLHLPIHNTDGLVPVSIVDRRFVEDEANDGFLTA